MASSARNEPRCPTCGGAVAAVTPRPKHYPFCSVRCQLADLGKWLDEEYRVVGAQVLLDGPEDE